MKYLFTVDGKQVYRNVDLGGVCLYTAVEDDQKLLQMTRKIRKLRDEYRNGDFEINIQKKKYVPIGADIFNVSLDNEEIQACGKYAIALHYLQSVPCKAH